MVAVPFIFMHIQKNYFSYRLAGLTAPCPLNKFLLMQYGTQTLGPIDPDSGSHIALSKIYPGHRDTEANAGI